MASKRERIEQMLQERPDEVFLHYSLAMECLSDAAGEPDETAALAAFGDVRRLDPNHVPVYLQLGILHSRLEDNAAAREALETGIPIAAAAGDQHAISEMQAVLDSLPDE